MKPAEQLAMVVDDDPFVLEVMRQLLGEIGVTQVLTAENADAALLLLHSGAKVTTLFTDISMPGMDGPLFLRQLAVSRCAARIVLISSVAVDLMHSIGELGRSHGLNMVGFVHKPVTAAALRAMLDVPAAAPAPRRASGPEPAPELSRERLTIALREREIRPWYQPKLDCASLRLVGVEALARWKMPDGKMVSPGSFVPAVEAHGLATDLFLCILDAALDDIENWQARDIAIKVAVNLSMDSALELDLPDKLATLLVAHEATPDQIVIEVTESRLMADRSSAMETLTRLSLMGFKLSIDDFGTGYSSLSQLADLPFQELKVDGSFVRRAGIDFKADAILGTTVTFGRSLGMHVVAEGVETFEQVDVLRRIGAMSLQGFLFARPMPAGDLVEWLADWRPGLLDKPGCTRRPTLLVVDDSPSLRVVIDTLLGEHLREWQIIQAANAEEAEAVLARQPLDAMTIDYHMPGSNGIDLVKLVRNRQPATRLVLLTSNLSESVAAEATALGAMYCPKPLTPPQVQRIAAYCLAP